MSFVLLKPEVLQKIFELRVDQAETQQWAGEASLVKENKKTSRIVLLTECALYIIKKSRIKPYEVSKTESIINLIECVINKDELTVKFKNRTYIFVLPESGSLMNNLYRAYRNITWNLNTNAVNDIYTIEEAQKMIPPPTSRPPNIFLFRYIAASISKEAAVEPEAIELIMKYDSHPKKIITLANSNLQTSIPFFFALSLEPELRSVVLDNFSPQILGSLLTWILVSSNKFLSLTLRNYDNAIFKGLSNRRTSYNHCDTVSFVHCTSNFVKNFLTAIKAATYSITSLVFIDIKISDDLSPVMSKALQSYAFASNISTLSFIDTQSELGFLEFLVNILKLKETIKQLKVENCGIDICQLLSIINNIPNELQVLSLRRNYGNHILTRDDMIPFSILHLDVGDSEWNSESLNSFILALCRWNRKLPFALDIDHIHLNTSWSESFSHLPVESLRSVITEINMSNNVMDYQAFEQFLTFLATQSPLLTNSPSKLMYLSISGCFVDQVSDCVSQLLRFCLMRELWGLSICDTITPTNADLMDVLLNQLADIQGLTSLDISGNYIQDSAAQSLLRFVRDSSSIAELAFDRCGITDSEQMLYLYECLMLSPHILAFHRPIDDLKPISHYNETKRINSMLKKKRQHSTTVQRLSLYLSLFGDFASRVISPIRTIEDSEDNSLFEQNFTNPIASLFTLASTNSTDVTVDPLASMVTEYIATSGKYGIVPPTAPPPTPPQRAFEMPTIFATMQMYTDSDPAFKVDEATVDLSSISVQLSATLANKTPKFSIFGPKQPKVDLKKVVTIPLVDFGHSQ